MLLLLIIFNFLNEEDPHLAQTIFPPKERSEIKFLLPHLRHVLFTIIFIFEINNRLLELNITILKFCKESHQKTKP